MFHSHTDNRVLLLTPAGRVVLSSLMSRTTEKGGHVERLLLRWQRWRWRRGWRGWWWSSSSGRQRWTPGDGNTMLVATEGNTFAGESIVFTYIILGTTSLREECAVGDLATGFARSLDLSFFTNLALLIVSLNIPILFICWHNQGEREREREKWN